MSASMPQCGLYVGGTTHARVGGQSRFSYRMFGVLIDVDCPKVGGVCSRLFGVNKIALLSFYDKDHGDRGLSSLRHWVTTLLGEAKLDTDVGAIRLLCMPRIFGFVFNPISVFFIYRQDGALNAVIYEVNNTFGETHCYIAPIDTPSDLLHTASKQFHVSPFFAVEGDYEFSLKPPGDDFSLKVTKKVAGAADHVATWSGRFKLFTNSNIMLTWLSMPLLTFWVVFSIHWQAVRLLLAGARYHRKPMPPTRRFTLATPRKKSA